MYLFVYGCFLIACPGCVSSWRRGPTPKLDISTDPTKGHVALGRAAQARSGAGKPGNHGALSRLGGLGGLGDVGRFEGLDVGSLHLTRSCLVRILDA